MRDMLEEMGLEKERLRMVNISAAMARPLADAITDMVETVRKLGPSPVTRNGQKTEDRGCRTEDGVASSPKSVVRNPKSKKVEKTS